MHDLLEGTHRYREIMKELFDWQPRRQQMKKSYVKASYQDPQGNWHPVEEILSDKIDAPEDNWIHRDAGMRCHTCMWYVRKSGGKGRCRRHAPTLGGWPVMFDSDWCGDHKLA